MNLDKEIHPLLVLIGRVANRNISRGVCFVWYYELEIVKIGRKRLSLSWENYIYNLCFDCVIFKKN